MPEDANKTRLGPQSMKLGPQKMKLGPQTSGRRRLGGSLRPGGRLGPQTTAEAKQPESESSENKEKEDEVKKSWGEEEMPTSDGEEAEVEMGIEIDPEKCHMLETEWSFWFDKRQSSTGRQQRGIQTYENNLKKIGSFKTVEGLWAYLNHMSKPSQIEVNANYHIFKSGIKPMWEDKANQKGGKWILHLKRDRQYLDGYWQNIILGLVGEMIDEHNDICGAVVSRRQRGDRIAVWNKNKENSDAIMKLGAKIKEKASEGVNPMPAFTMEYSCHDDSMKSGLSYANPKRFTL